MKSRLHLYFHSPCFDGIASAVLARDFLRVRHHVATRDLHAIDYASKPGWLARRLPTASAVVDFLFHPGATFWADHHGTTFLREEDRSLVATARNPDWIYQDQAASCALLLWNQLEARHGHRNESYRTLVEWADRIDGARYDSVEEAVLPESPALRINLSLTLGRSGRYCERLVDLLQTRSLEQVARHPDVRRRADRVLAGTERGMREFRRAARLENGVVVFDVRERQSPINRYLPYVVFPKADYSAGIVRRGDSVKITAMRNPWKEFEGVRIGSLFESVGGGGHPRVGSVLLEGRKAAKAQGVLKSILLQLAGSPRSRTRG